MTRPDCWTIGEALAQFAQQGMPVDPARFRLAVRAARLHPAGRRPSGPRGGRGEAVYPIGELQRLHDALWLAFWQRTP